MQLYKLSVSLFIRLRKASNNVEEESRKSGVTNRKPTRFLPTFALFDHANIYDSWI